MKLIFVKTALCAGLLVSTQLYADEIPDGTITINGLVVDTTCVLKADDDATSGSNTIITLENIRPSQLINDNSNTTAESFTLTLKASDGTSACNSATTGQLKSVTLSLAADKYHSEAKTVILNQDTAVTVTNDDLGRIDLQILAKATPSSSFAAIDFSANTAARTSSDVTNGEITYQARYYKIGSEATKPQNVTATVNYTLNYN